MNQVGRPRKVDPDTALCCAMDVFWDKGFDATSMADLVKATGLHKGSLYQLFGDKESLFLKALESYINGIRVELQQIASTTKDPYDALKAVVNYMVGMFSSGDQHSKGCFAMKTMSNTAPHNPRISKFIESSNEEYFALMHGLVDAAGKSAKLPFDSFTATSLLMTTMSGLCTQLQSSMTQKQGLQLAYQQLSLVLGKSQTD